MKKIRNIGLVLGLIILISSNSEAQYFYTSYGYAQNWYIPKFVDHTIQNNYYGYEIAHVKKFSRRGHTNFNVLLHRNGRFMEIRIDRHGHIYKTVNHRWNYPLTSHSCSGHCGYHGNYYTTYYPQYHHNYYQRNHHNTYYSNSNNGHYNKQHNNSKKYYTNVYVEKQHKQNHYQNNQQSNVKTNNGNQNQRTNGEIRKPSQQNRRSENVVRSTNNSQQQRNNTVIRKPQQSNNNATYTRPQQNGSSARSQYIKSAGSTSSRNNDNAKKVMAYKNRRPNQDK